MGKTGQRVTVRAFVTGAVVMASILGAVVQPATAAPQKSDKPAKSSYKLSGKVNDQFTKKRDVSVNGSGGSGGRTGDFDRKGKEDILAVAHNPSSLYVYPNKGYNGANPTATYGPAVAINHNWAGQRWVGQGKINNDVHPDVLAIDFAGNLVVHKHSGTFAGTGTLNGSQLISTGWNDYDIAFTSDADGNGLDDVIARKKGTEEYYWFGTVIDETGKIGQTEPVHIASFQSDSSIVDAGVADFSGDGVYDWVLRRQDGLLFVFDPTVDNGEGQPKGKVYLLGYGWTGINAFVISDVNTDGDPDILGRVAANGDLTAYLHTGVWNPTTDDTVFDTIAPSKVVGLQWNGHRIIT
ncbi:hypothetical protein ALI144C_42265 [Actinosynnema sp. ALI-1.44]|uniref:hypothetical protein n=1 Tax=Actinosynnema sp. ALI-1.44 TaxID=1933779 RepID=UPI00097C8F78|nr:hypothetical protein [Actinosynnema sp. ALI-1.44]ONI72647.1 hypothetical protein ALI144C_42265 [Actinosynnema sp. ALI-1.44]